MYVDWVVRFAGSNWFYVMYLPILNFLLIIWIGRYALSAIMYPY